MKTRSPVSANHSRALTGRILVVDDEESMRRFIRRSLERRGHLVEVAASAEEALGAANRSRFDLVFLDIKLPGRSGLDILPALIERIPRPRVVVMTGNSTLENAVRAVGSGASAYIEKPFSLEKMNALTVRELMAAAGERRDAAAIPESDGNFQSLYPLLEEISRVAATDLPVLIEGEAGTEKYEVARAIHRLGPRADGPFVTSVLGSGKLQGSAETAIAADIEKAGNGTLYVEEVSGLPAEAQKLLIRALEGDLGTGVEAEHARSPRPNPRFRLISSTSGGLDHAVRSGAFREDLFFRIQVVPLVIPALRDRPGEIARLASRMLSEIAGPGVEFEPSALARLCAHKWPRNVWELRNVVERCAATRSGKVIKEEELPDGVRNAFSPGN